MNSLNTCSDSALLNILIIVKRFVLIIQIIVPILLLCFGCFSLIKLVKDPEEKNGLKKIYNQFLAATIVFFVPVIVNALMFILGEKTSISSCWSDAAYEMSSSANYYEVNEGKKKHIILDSGDYEAGKTKGNLNAAKLAVRVAPTATPQSPLHTPKHYSEGGAWCKINNSSLYDYFKIMDAVIGKYPGHDNSNHSLKGGITNNNAYASCVQAAAGILRATVDSDLETGGPDSILSYLKQNTTKWTRSGRLVAGQKYDDYCQPGDLLLVYQGSSSTLAHVMLYVGNEAVKEKFPKSNGNIFEASYHSNQYPTISHISVAGSVVDIWRPTGKGDFHYPFIDIEEVLSGNVNLNKQMC